MGKKRSYLLILVLVLILALSGFFPLRGNAATAENGQGREISLWLVTEESVSDGMNSQVQALVRQFEAAHPAVTIRVDILPTQEGEREACLEKLHALIGAGKGPDLYLLPTQNVLTLEHPRKYSYTAVAPVFSDLTAAMYAGTFLDLSAWFDADADLGKSALNGTVMDAGVVDGARYALPLRYDAPVVYVWEDALAREGADPDVLAGGIDDWMAYAVESGNAVLAQGADYLSMDAFSHVADYGRGEVRLTAEALAEYLTLAQQVGEMVGTEISHRSAASLMGYAYDLWKPVPVQLGRLSHALLYSAIAQAEQKRLEIYPLRTVEGDYIAEVTYFAAVGAQCAEPEAAYGFVRQFLLAQAQWEADRPMPADGQYPGLVEKGLPVRMAGGTAPVWQCYRRQAAQMRSGAAQAAAARLEKIGGQELTGVQILTEAFDGARFPLPELPTFGEIGALLNDRDSGDAAKDIDLAQASNRLIGEISALVG